jgi:methionyl aminopeptidase
MSDPYWDRLRAAGTLIRKVFAEASMLVESGAICQHIDQHVTRRLAENKARSTNHLFGLPGSINISLNEQVVQGIPDERVLRAGDLVKLDMAIQSQGVYVDKAVSMVIDPAHYLKRYLKSSVDKCMTGVFEFLRAGISTDEIGQVISGIATSQRLHVGKQFSGHSIGLAPHEEPLVPNYPTGKGVKLRVGAVIAVEPILFLEANYRLIEIGNTIESDVLSVHAEDTVIIHENSCEVIT